MATKKTKEKDTKTTKGKKTATKPKTTKKAVKEEPVVEEVEVKEALENGELVDNNIIEPTEEQVKELARTAEEDDEKFKYAQSVVENIVNMTKQDEIAECSEILNETPKRETQIDAEENSEETANNRTDETTEDEVVSATIEGDNVVLEQENGNTVEVEVSSLVQEENEGPSLDVIEDIVNHEETANCQTNEAEEYKILVDEYGSNMVSVTQGTSSQTCIEEKQVQELAEETKQEVKPKTRWFGRRKFSWMGKIFDI